MYVADFLEFDLLLTIHVKQDEGKFDPASIPLKSWAAFEDELCR